MVTVEHEDEAGWLKLWIDGYLPAWPDVARMREEITGLEIRDLPKPHEAQYRRDVLFNELLDALTNAYVASWRDRSSDSQMYPACLNRTYATFTLQKADLPGYPQMPVGFHQELDVADRPEDYRGLLFIFSASTYPDGKRKTLEILDELRFQNRPATTYRDLDRFLFGCELFLQPLAYPYWAPELVVKRMLASSGFRPLY